eukprot:9490007-Pyramimonas_sp.AAC.1
MRTTAHHPRWQQPRRQRQQRLTCVYAQTSALPVRTSLPTARNYRHWRVDTPSTNIAWIPTAASAIAASRRCAAHRAGRARPH